MRSTGFFDRRRARLLAAALAVWICFAGRDSNVATAGIDPFPKVL